MRLAALPLLFAPLLSQAAVLSVCTEASPEGFDVVRYNSLTTTNAAADMLMSRLVEFDAGRGQLQPGLAERWTASADGTVWDFQLRHGVKFHHTAWFQPTRELNADDVLFSFQRMLDATHPWHKTAPSGYPHAQSMQWPTLIERIEAPDPYTVRFTLKRADATFLASLSMGFASIYSAEYADQLMRAGTPDVLNRQPVGTGPFALKRFQRDAVVRYSANPDYFAGKPALDSVVFAITPEPVVRLQKLRRGECHIALSPKPLDVRSARQDEHLQVSETPAFMTAFLALNSQHPPLDKPQVRQAINLAFDRTSYLKAVFEGSAQATTGVYPPTTWSYASELTPYPHDPARARTLLAEAGLANGFDTTIWTRPSGSLLNPNPSLGAQLLQADLATVGIRAQIRVIEWGELIRRAKAGEHDLLFMGWAGDNGDPDNFLSPQFSCAAVKTGTNFARYCSEALDGLIGQGKASADQAVRSTAYHQAQRIIHDQALWLPLAHPTASVLLSDKVQSYQANPFGRQDFSRVSLRP